MLNNWWQFEIYINRKGKRNKKELIINEDQQHKRNDCEMVKQILEEKDMFGQEET